MTEHLTAKLPGTGGSIRNEPEDFQVDEIPLYEPCGEGDHLYLRVEKTGLSTYALLRELANALDCNEREIGYAGLKDANAITRQTVSVPLRKPEDVKGLNIRGVNILSARLHRNKLKPGHLSGNQFVIHIHEPDEDSCGRARDILKVLSNRGVPNRFGRQRYGSLGNSHRVGKAILNNQFSIAVDEIIGAPEAIEHPGWKAAAESYRRGDIAGALETLPPHCRPERNLLNMLKDGRSHHKAIKSLPRKLLKLYISAYQSSLFDRMVDMRMATFGQLWAGDIAFKHDNGACFKVTDPAAEQPRADDFEISPTAPLYGYKVKLATAHAGLLEESLLESEKLTLASFRLPGGLAMEGERRPLRVPIHGVRCEKSERGMTLSFSLPKGSFATTVLDEVMKVKTT
jgi:tRNA pseudouridine13 synthase